MRSWIDCLRRSDWPLMLEPPPSRGRSLRELTVTGFRPFERLPAASETGRFDWESRQDAPIAAAIATSASLISFAERVERAWARFLLESAPSLEPPGRLVATARGNVAYADLVAFHAVHAAFHLRELVTFARSRGVTLPEAVEPGLELPPP